MVKPRIVQSESVAEVTHHETLEEAIAEALRGAPPGCAVVIHDAECEWDEDHPVCSCFPMEIRTGAEA